MMDWSCTSRLTQECHGSQLGGPPCAVLLQAAAKGGAPCTSQWLHKGFHSSVRLRSIASWTFAPIFYLLLRQQHFSGCQSSNRKHNTCVCCRELVAALPDAKISSAELDRLFASGELLSSCCPPLPPSTKHIPHANPSTMLPPFLPLPCRPSHSNPSQH